ncbi:hypothetical protein P9139_20935 [Curtobacterium flaccumfaciens]|nr:hypothetical protein P9139_20935 [Curtobacterium flaccumfaciens]
MLLSDAVVLGGVAVGLWHSGRSTVADGPASLHLALVAGIGLVVVVRQCIHRAPVLARRNPRAVRTDRIVTAADLVGLVALCAVWRLGGSYFTGWLTAAAGSLVIGVVPVQLIADVVTGRNDTGDGRRFVTPETLRLLLIVVGFAALFLTADVHQWRVAIIDLVLLLGAGGAGLGTVVHAVLARRR